MIVKKEWIIFIRDRKKPIPLQKLDASIPRLAVNADKLSYLRMEAAKMQKGYNGERKLDYHLRSLPDTFAVLNDVTLTIFGKKFQIDSLIISAYAIYTPEVKSFEGTVTFNTLLRQFIQNSGKKLQGYKYPISQVETIHFHLLRWLQQRGLAGLPIYHFIAFSEQSTIINVQGDERALSNVVSYVDEIPVRVMKKDAEVAKESASNNNLKNRVISTIMRECEEFDYDIFERFGFSLSDIQPGVHCPECGKLGMVRSHGKWHCLGCGAYSKDAHKKALYDYSLLFSPKITNEECRKFLLLKSRFIARKMLQDSHFSLKNRSKVWINKNQLKNLI
ncbi:nuclease-related domain-containing protein [Pseudogracilibacillus sp. SO30301A]|uniref:nuclease-related domain-containing protein n=1 Tax=Pseudogracilibacillus sp. SO30301A TaxID=3098291 RepID=UPI00300E3C0C